MTPPIPQLAGNVSSNLKQAHTHRTKLGNCYYLVGGVTTPPYESIEIEDVES